MYLYMYVFIYVCIYICMYLQSRPPPPKRLTASRPAVILPDQIAGRSHAHTKFHKFQQGGLAAIGASAI